MNRISIWRFSMAWGITGALLYFGCILVMWTVGRENTIFFFNSLLHGLDVEPIIRMDIPWWEAVMGIIETFVLGWLIGGVIASIYNFGAAGETIPPEEQSE